MRPQRHGVRREERLVAGEQLTQQAAERVDVRGSRDRLAEALLGRHVRGSADRPVDLGEPGQRAGALQDRDAEVEHLDQAALGDHHVGRLDVAVHDVHPVHVGQDRRDLRRDRRRPGNRRSQGNRRGRPVRIGRSREVRPVEQRLERRAAQQLHDQPDPRRSVRPGLHPGVVDGRRAGVLQPGGHPDLPQEPPAVPVLGIEDLSRLGRIRRYPRCRARRPQHLDRHPPVEPLVVAEVDLAHAAPPEQPVHPVPPGQQLRPARFRVHAVAHQGHLLPFGTNLIEYRRSWSRGPSRLAAGLSPHRGPGRG